MTEYEYNKILDMALDKSKDDKSFAKSLIKMLADSVAVDKIRATMDEKSKEKTKLEIEDDLDKEGYFKLTKKELNKMPNLLKNAFITNNMLIKYRYIRGMYQARATINGVRIEVASTNYEIMKEKFINKLNSLTETGESERKRIPKFKDYAYEWLKIKEKTTKASTYKSYKAEVEYYLIPAFGRLNLNEIKRTQLQEFLFSYVEEGKARTAKKLKLHLKCIFDLAKEDFDLKSPVDKIVLPYYEAKKGSAFTKEEEAKLIDLCINNKNIAGTSGLLVLLFFGLRRSELATLRVIDNKYLECDTSKERMGRNVVKRRIPFTPMAHKFLEHINFDEAKNVNVSTVCNRLKKWFPNHHAHELRYTFITRCKECGVNPEVVMLWAGHESDKDVKSSKVDRGYTDYSQEYILAEAKKVNYQLKNE